MSKKYVTFGEIMLRLRSQELYRLFQTPSLEATFGGGEANVAVSLSIFGEKAVFVTVSQASTMSRAEGSESISLRQAQTRDHLSLFMTALTLLSQKQFLQISISMRFSMVLTGSTQQVSHRLSARVQQIVLLLL